VEIVVPLRIFDYYFYIRIDRLRRCQYPFTAHPDHKLTAVIGPDPVAARLFALIALAIGEKKIVNHNLIEHRGRVFEDFLQALLRALIGITGNQIPACRNLADLCGRNAT